jgi:glutathione S-transferase
MLRLHDNASSGNAYKVRLLLSRLGIPFERIEYDIDRGATRTPEFLRNKNANGRIPVLELDDGRCLAESNAILWFLAEGTPLLPAADGEAGRWLRAQVQLRGRAFFVGDSYSIADIALYAYTHVAAEGGFDLGPFPAVRAWLGRVAAEHKHLAITD